MTAAVDDLSMDCYLQQRRESGGSFPDPIYNHADLGPLAMEFVDTPPVQRLRHLKQLGCASYAFPTAEHSRFVHSVGVGHLAGQATMALRATGLDVQPIDVELQEVAGVCHDLGHGPFSHVFESEFLPAVLGRHDWCHEAMSARLLEYLIDENNIDLHQQYIKRIQDIISSGGKRPQQLVWERDSAWQLQIVANGINGIDVDKIDYLQRDARMTGVRCSYDFTSLLLRDCKVIDGTICFPDSKQTFVADLYNARWSMHRDVYQHRKSKAAEYMVVDILKAADPVLGISSRIHSPEEFIQLDDSLVREIHRAACSNPSEPRLQEAAAILNRLERRQLYDFVAEATVPAEALEADYVSVTASDVVSHQAHNSGVMLQPDDILVHNMKIDFCSGSKDPLTNVMLYSSDGSVRSAADGRIHRPAHFIFRQVRVFLRRHCPDPTRRQQYVAAAQTALTRAMQHRYGQQVEVFTSPGSRRSSRRTAAATATAAAAKAYQQQRYGLLLQQQLDHAGSGASSSSLVGHQIGMQGIVKPWSLQQQQQQQGSAAAAAAADLGDFVPATDDEDDVIPDNAAVDEDMAATQFGAQLAGAGVLMQQ